MFESRDFIFKRSDFGYLGAVLRAASEAAR